MSTSCIVTNLCLFSTKVCRKTTFWLNFAPVRWRKDRYWHKKAYVKTNLSYKKKKRKKTATQWICTIPSGLRRLNITVIHFYFGSVQFSIKRKFAVSVQRKFRLREKMKEKKEKKSRARPAVGNRSGWPNHNATGLRGVDMCRLVSLRSVSPWTLGRDIWSTL